MLVKSINSAFSYNICQAPNHVLEEYPLLGNPLVQNDDQLDIAF